MQRGLARMIIGGFCSVLAGSFLYGILLQTLNFAQDGGGRSQLGDIWTRDRRPQIMKTQTLSP